MSKRKTLIVLLLLLLALLVLYLIILSSEKKSSTEESVKYPYTNWMSEPNNKENDNNSDNGIIVFKQE